MDAFSDSDEQDAYEHQLGPNPSLALAQHPQIERLRATLAETLPYCCGTVTLPADSFVLYYGKTEQACRLNLLRASEDALDYLESVCEPATFGVAQRNVLDTTYRKAGKLDRDHFAINLDVERSGVLDAVRTALFIGKGQGRAVRATLYKLNVYGRGSFFKAHKDTPRSATMFASLVLVFPTTHTGGTLVFRHEGHEWAFDAAGALSSPTASPPAVPDPRVAYVAFYSDVEHEVAPVLSGHRVTITYNLYYIDEVQHSLMERVSPIQPRGASEPEVKSIIMSLLEDETFLPAGGTLGFGLRHLYPLPTSFDAHEDHTLDTLRDGLKGMDAALFLACKELHLAPSFRTIFEAQSQAGADAARLLVACPRVVKLSTHEWEEEPPVWEKLCRNWDGVLVNPPSEHLAPERLPDATAPIKGMSVHWVTSVSGANRVKTRFAAYGNEPMMGYLYQRICMLVHVGPPGARASHA